MRPLKLLLLSEVFPPQSGGSGRWFFEVYRRLPREAVCVAAGEFPGAEEFDRTHALDIHRLPLTMPAWGLKSASGLRDYWRLFRALKRLVRQEGIDRLHVGRDLPEGWLAWMLNRWCGLPYLVYVHGEELNLGVQSREMRWMMRRVFGRAERVIVNSRNTARLMRDWAPDEKVTILHPGVDTERFTPSARDIQVRRDLGWGDRPVVLTVGRLQKRKGHDMLIRALPRICQAMPDVLYVIVGDGGERKALEALSREVGVSDCVHFAGEISDDAMIRCYQQCDLFVLPNREVDGDIEGFGMVLLEAQSCGKPVVAGDSGGTAETMIPGETGLIVDCTSPGPLAEAVIELLRDGPRREAMGSRARQWVVERFDWAALAAQAATVFGLGPCAGVVEPSKMG
jgi:phosphatidylinositol alpha-1,6-mannosyltransferase